MSGRGEIMEKQRRILSGKGNGFGLVKGVAVREEEQTAAIIKRSVADVLSERLRWENATLFVKSQIEEQFTKATNASNNDEAGILTAHLALLDDPTLVEAVLDVITEERCCAEWALRFQTEKICGMLKKSNNPVIQERTFDIFDLSAQLMKALTNIETDPDPCRNSPTCDGKQDISVSSDKCILIKDTLYPSDVIHFNFARYHGIIVAHGSWTTHSSILARSKSIPMAILDHGDEIRYIEDGLDLILDADEGSVTLSPMSEDYVSFEARVKKNEEALQLFAHLKNCPMITNNGRKILFEANISGPDDLPSVIHSGAQGVGLFRTEFLYYNQSSLPGEDRQYQIYSEVLQAMRGLPVTFRTFDIGGDKQVPGLNLPKEANPFLGYRAIRIALAEPELFKTQIRAILRAAVGSPVRIMFPMISTVEELEQAKAMVWESQRELQSKGMPCSERIKLGMMVEIPSAAVLADDFAQRCDFFSIGTNDLVQYTMACDRMNEKVQNLYRIDNPAVLQLIKNVAEAAHRHGIEVAICGEAASNIDMIPIWLDYGIDVLSMSSSVLPKIQVSCYQLGLIRKEHRRN